VNIFTMLQMNRGGVIKYYVHNDITSTVNILPIFFHGALDRDKITLPRYEGISLFKRLRCPAISFADPSLDQNKEITLAWFAGNASFLSLQKGIHDLLENIATKTSVRLLLHGGSGGGFAALTQQYLFGKKTRHMALVQNPQTSILRYHKTHIARWLNLFTGDLSNPQEKLNELGIIHSLRMEDLTNVIYFQNASDIFHIKNHLESYMESPLHISNGILFRPGNTFFVGNWGEGHARLPFEFVRMLISDLIHTKDYYEALQCCCSRFSQLPSPSATA